MADFFDELKSEMQEESLFQFWASYRKYIIGAVLAILVGTGAYLWLQHRQETLLGQQSTLYEQAVELLSKGEEETALELFSELENTGHGYRELAALRKAALLGRRAVQNTNSEEVPKISQNVGQNFENIALLVRNAQQLEAKKINPHLQKKLNDLTSNGNPWKGLAAELLILWALQAKDGPVAIEHCKRLLDSDVSPQIRQRGMIEAVGLKMGIPAD